MDTETYKYNSVAVARMIVAAANAQRIAINMTKLQKLLYICYGAYLAANGQRLTNEHPQAWPFGPVFPTTRNKLLKEDLYAIRLDGEPLAEIRNDEDFKSLLRSVFQTFGLWTASQLTEWSHGDGTPWERTTELDGFKWGMQIPDEYISSYFKNLMLSDGGEQR